MEADVVEPPISYMRDVIEGEQGIFDGFPRQYVNWANQYLSIDKIYVRDELISIKAIWVLYEACTKYLKEVTEKENV